LTAPALNLSRSQWRCEQLCWQRDFVSHARSSVMW
jgi:hypothetical protein